MRGFEQIPWLYDAGMAVNDALGLRRWRRWLAIGARGRTLEVGCGTGRNLSLYPPGMSVVGLDPELDALLVARRRAPGAMLVAARAEALPFRDGTFDTVTTSLVFCSVGDPPRGFAEIGRVLRPDGRLRMFEHVRSTRPLVARLQSWIAPAWVAVSGGCHPDRDTEAAVTRAGFELEERKARGVMRRLVGRPPPGSA